jgi:hypothetical protein
LDAEPGRHPVEAAAVEAGAGEYGIGKQPPDRLGQSSNGSSSTRSPDEFRTLATIAEKITGRLG